MTDVLVLGTEIPNNEALSGVVDLGGYQLVAIEMPSSWSGTTLTFQAKNKNAVETGDNETDDAESWKDLYNDAGTEVSVTVAANRIVGVATAVIKDAIAPIRYLRIRSGTSAA